MGLVRLILSLLVVGSHFGKIDEPVGGTAVAAFFAISGFLMARTIRENYPGLGGALRFYVNRCVRIVPPFAAVLALTALFLTLRGPDPFLATPQGAVEMPDVEFPPAWSQLVRLRPDSPPTYLFAQVFLAPQTWSLVVEGVFYLAAPLLAVFAFSRGHVLLWGAGAGSLALAGMAAISPAGNIWLRSPVSSVWIFILGMLTYAYAAGRPAATGAVRHWLALVPAAAVVALGLDMFPVPHRSALFISPVLMALWLWGGQWATRRSGRVDQALGNIAYGVFVGHFLSALVMLGLNEAIYLNTGVFPFGIPGQSERVWRVMFYVFSLLGGTAIYLGLERPLERTRARLRRAAALGTRDETPVPAALS